MSKLITVAGSVANPNAPRIIRTPGVSGYASRFIASHLNIPVGNIVPSWTSVAGTAPITLNPLSGTTSTVTLAQASGVTYLHSPGNSSTGGRLLGPHTEQRPYTIAAVVRSPASSTTAVLGSAGVGLNLNATPVWQGDSNVDAYSTNGSTGWVFAILQVTADSLVRVRADTAEAVSPAGLAAAPTSFGGVYFGPTTAGKTADIAELVYWPRELNLTERDAVHAYMRTRYSVLS